jgi:hypothetical protein
LSVDPLTISSEIIIDSIKIRGILLNMAKSIKKNPKVKTKVKSKEIQYLEKLMRYSLLYVQGKSPELDSLFTQQAERLQVQIDKLERNQ